MKRGGMSKAPQIDMKNISETAKTTAQSSSVPALNQLHGVLNKTQGDTMTVEVAGQPVKFTLHVIPAEQVERKTMVWGANERLQELLTESALDDLIPTFTTDGQQFPAIGRDVNGVIEVADGSRRRKAAILTQSQYCVWVGELDDRQMASLSEVGNDYRPTSAYERGKRYKRMIDTVYNGNVKAMTEAEKLARRVVIRCLATAELPVEIIKLFSNPTELSARAGEELQKVYKEHPAIMMNMVEELAMYRRTEVLEADFIIKTLKGAKPSTEKPEVRVRTFGKGITAKYKGDAVEISIQNAPDNLIRRIEALLENMEKGGNSKEVEELFAKLEERTGKA